MKSSADRGEIGTRQATQRGQHYVYSLETGLVMRLVDERQGYVRINNNWTAPRAILKSDRCQSDLLTLC